MKKEQEGVRINKYISDYGFCSRREADALIENERVTINNRVATPGDRVSEGDKVRIDGEHLAYVPKEARPKKHRWGPPRNTEAAEEQEKQRRGQRGAARNSRPKTTTKTTATQNKTKTKASTPKTNKTQQR